MFGYAWNLPQLIKEAGLEYFFTIKIGWSQYNRFPYDSFWWQGLDGTRVLTHFSTTKKTESFFAATYNSDATPDQTLGTWTNFQQKDYGSPGVTPPLLMSYGWGDGGGGPTREMLENIREMGEFPSTPHIHTGRVGEFFRKLENDVGDALPTWNGELYLEYHRGTYTTQARNKRANRKSEFLLHDAEFLAAYASHLDPDYQYPHADFSQAWRLVCLNQFHDIIPGSSIGPVYEESLEQYEHVRQSVTVIRNQALDAIAKKLSGAHLVVNPTSFTRNDPIEVDGEIVGVGELPPYSISPVKISDTQHLVTLMSPPRILKTTSCASSSTLMVISPASMTKPLDARFSPKAHLPTNSRPSKTARSVGMPGILTFSTMTRCGSQNRLLPLKLSRQAPCAPPSRSSAES